MCHAARAPNYAEAQGAHRCWGRLSLRFPETVFGFRRNLGSSTSSVAYTSGSTIGNSTVNRAPPPGASPAEILP